MNIYCVEQNYGVDKQDREEPVTSELAVFIKPSEALSPPGAILHYPDFDKCSLYVQCEIVVRLSANGQNISAGEAANYYDAFTTGINFTQINVEDAREGKKVPWEMVKGFTHSSVIGEWFPASSVTDIRDINFCLYNNREMVQIGNSEWMIHDLNTLVSLISQNYVLEKGDIIFTGTPIGLGEVFKGDHLEAFWEDDTAVEVSIG